VKHFASAFEQTDDWNFPGLRPVHARPRTRRGPK